MRKVVRILTNKFLLTGLAFVVWVAYFDQNDWFSQQKRKKELQETIGNITYLQKEITRMKAERDGLQKDPAVLERFAREHYRLKRDNEDVYVFE